MRTLACNLHTSHDGTSPERDGRKEDENDAKTRRSTENFSVVEPVLQRCPDHGDRHQKNPDHTDPGASNHRHGSIQERMPRR